jgi:CBS domain-containing protein
VHCLFYHDYEPNMQSSAILQRVRTLLERTPPFDRLTETERADLLKDLTIEYYETGEVIIEQGFTMPRNLYIVESGLVRLMDMDQQRLIDKCGEGDTFGAFGLIKGGTMIYEAKAVEPTVCALLKAERFQKVYSGDEAFAAFFDNDLNQYVRRLGTTVDVTGAHLLFSRRLGVLNHRPVITCDVDTTVQQAARVMHYERASAILVQRGPEVVGLFTNSDLRSRVVAHGRSLETPVEAVMSSPVVSITTEARLFDAMMRMLQHRVSHLVIQRADGTPLGVLSDRDLAHFRGQDPVASVRRLEMASSVDEMASVRTEVGEQLLYLYQQGVQPEQLTAILSVVYDRIAVRVLELVERDLRSAPEAVTLPWAWLRMGSGGRQEMALSTKQHNALVYANPEDAEEAERAQEWFERLATRANWALEVCGFPGSDIVARDSRWRMPLLDWQKTFRSWIHEADGATLTTVPLFLDLRCIYGEAKLEVALKADIGDALNIQAMDKNRHFLSMMMQNALTHRPPLSFFKQFVLERTGEHRNTFDIRERGILPVADAARVLALELRFFDSTNTFTRLRHAASALPELETLIQDTLEAYQYVFDFRLEHQLRAIELGEPPNNFILPTSLTKIQRNLLRTAFETIMQLQEQLAKRYEKRRR